MTILYKCDRCGNATEKEGMATLRYTTMGPLGPMEVTFHYCDFCSLIAGNALSIVNNGTYNGVLDLKKNKAYYTEKKKETAKNYDPLFDKKWFRVNDKEA